MQTVLCKRPLTTYNMYRERHCCTMHIAKATDVFSSHDCIFHVERVPQIDIFYSLLAASICFHRGRHRCDTVMHALSPTYTRSVFEGGFEFLRPSVRGTPTTHSEGLLLRVGALPCAPTYNCGMVQHVVFNRLGLTQPHECSLKVVTCHANSTAVQAASNSI